MSATETALIVGGGALSIAAAAILLGISNRHVGWRRDIGRFGAAVGLAAGLMITAGLLRRFVVLVFQPSNASTSSISLLGLILTVISGYSIYLLAQFQGEKADQSVRLKALENTAQSLVESNSRYIDTARFNTARLTAYIRLNVLIDEQAGQDDAASNQAWLDLTLIQYLITRGTARTIAFDLEGLCSIERLEPGRISAIVAERDISPYFTIAYDEEALRLQADFSAQQWQEVRNKWNIIRPT